jgi:putative endonuclease
MPYWIYVIESQASGRYYCGHTDDVERRVNQHNDPEYRPTRTTKIWKGPWRLVWTRECPNRSEAVTLERQIKKRGIGRYLEKVQLAESRRRRD